MHFRFKQIMHSVACVLIIGIISTVQGSGSQEYHWWHCLHSTHYRVNKVTIMIKKNYGDEERIMKWIPTKDFNETVPWDALPFGTLPIGNAINLNAVCVSRNVRNIIFRRQAPGEEESRREKGSTLFYREEEGTCKKDHDEKKVETPDNHYKQKVYEFKSQEDFEEFKTTRNIQIVLDHFSDGAKLSTLLNWWSMANPDVYLQPSYFFTRHNFGRNQAGVVVKLMETLIPTFTKARDLLLIKTTLESRLNQIYAVHAADEQPITQDRDKTTNTGHDTLSSAMRLVREQARIEYPEAGAIYAILNLPALKSVKKL